MAIDERTTIPVHMDVLRTKKSPRRVKMLSVDDNFVRCQYLAAEIAKLVMQYDVVAIGAEAMSFVRNSSSSAKVGMVWGVIATTALRYDLPVFQCTPQQLKDKVTGSKKASKEDVADAMRKMWPQVDFDDLLKKHPMGQHEHAWDALASVVVCLDAEPIKMLRRMIRVLDEGEVVVREVNDR